VSIRLIVDEDTDKPHNSITFHYNVARRIILSAFVKPAADVRSSAARWNSLDGRRRKTEERSKVIAESLLIVRINDPLSVLLRPTVPRSQSRPTRVQMFLIYWDVFPLNRSRSLGCSQITWITSRRQSCGLPIFFNHLSQRAVAAK
jgi:hypothetical protein